MKPIIKVLLLLLHLSVHGAQGATDPAEAAIEFKALCRLTKLLETPVVKSSPDPKVEHEVQEILKLNMSAAPESWRVNFGDGSAKHDWASIKGKYSSEPYGKDWETSWPDWLKAAAGIAPTDSNKDWLERHPRPATTQIAAAQLKPLAAKAKELQATYVTQYKVEVKDKEDLAEAKLKAALTEVHSTKGKDFNTFAATNGAARTNGDCNGDKAGQGVLYDIACLCIGAVTTETDGCMGAVLSEAWTASTGKLGEAMAELKKHCTQGFSPTLTSEALASAVTTVENLIGRRGRQGLCEIRRILQQHSDHPQATKSTMDDRNRRSKHGIDGSRKSQNTSCRNCS
uniref:Variant surface glycoprotein 1633 n=1 Tax=Trypanosoma brucei TaxID=5691 RepID=M4SVW7_9TRYP|nr:variant surface glycoprotein 1633 [Trypanosoma brucei]